MLTDIQKKSRIFESSKKVIVFLHGYGGCGENFYGISEEFSQNLKDTLLFFPDGPLEPPFEEKYVLSEGRGRMWFSLPIELTYSSLRRGLDWVCPYIKEYIQTISKKHNIPTEDISLVGFSQGSIISFEMLFYLNLDKIVAYSGLFAIPQPTPCVVSKDTRVLIIHSDDDNVVPFSNVRMMQESLNEIGILNSLHVCHNIGHSISQEGIDAAIRFLKS